MNSYLLNNAIDDILYSRLHSRPISDRMNSFAQMLPTSFRESHYYSIITVAAFITTFVASFVALAETIASFAYVLFTSLIHVVTLCRSKDLQNHVLQSWAFFIHTKQMILSPIHFLLNKNRMSEMEIVIREHFLRMKLAQNAQTFGELFDLRKGGARKFYGVSKAQIHAFEIALEGLPLLINCIKRYMPILLDENNKPLDPKQLDKLNELNFIESLEDSKMRLISLSYLSKNPTKQQKLIYDLVLQLCIFKRDQNLENFDLDKNDLLKRISRSSSQNFGSTQVNDNNDLLDINVNHLSDLESMDHQDLLYEIFNCSESINNDSISKDDGSLLYQRKLEGYVNRAVKLILSNLRYLNIMDVEPVETGYSHYENVKNSLKDLESIYPVHQFAQLMEIIDINQKSDIGYQGPTELIIGYKQDRKQLMYKALKAYEVLAENNAAKNLLIRMILQEKDFNIDSKEYQDKTTHRKIVIDDETRTMVRELYHYITDLATPFQYMKALQLTIINAAT